MTDAEITAVIKGLHPDLEVGDMELRVARAIAAAERERWIKMVDRLVSALELRKEGEIRLVDMIPGIIEAERERCAMVAEMPDMAKVDIVRVIRNG